MRNKLIKRITSLALTIIMSFMVCGVAFAADAHEGTAGLKQNCIDAVSVTSDDPFANSVYGTVPCNGAIDMYPTLSSYIGLTRKFYVSTSSQSTQGALFLYLYNSNGKLVSNDWIMSINGVYEWTLFLPSSGKYHLRVIAQGTDADVEIAAKWQN